MSIWILCIGIPLAIGLFAQMRVSGAFKKYSRVRADSNMTGADVAHAILNAAQIQGVEVKEINGFLGDHYDPTHRRLCLSSNVYRNPSIAAVGIAAHEVGHAIQHAKAYAPLQLRMAVVPVTQAASNLLPFVIMGGFFFQIVQLIWLGIACYLVLTLFQLITLPVEFDASNRAKIILRNMGIIRQPAEVTGVNRVLDAAALTYVAAFIASLGNLIYLLLIARNRD
jgi:Zn-dependent membrane protease YugP